VDVFEALQPSSAEKLTPCSGASGPTNPDQENSFIMRFEGEANEARHRLALPSAVGASGENCDCNRKGRRSGAHRRAAKNIFWNAALPVSYCGSFTVGLAAAGEAEGWLVLFSEEHPVNRERATHKIAKRNMNWILEILVRRVGGHKRFDEE